MYFCNTDSLYFSWHSRGDASSNSKICGSIVFTVTGYFLLDSHGKVTRARILPETNRKKKTFWSQIINLTWIYVLFSVTLWIFKMIFSDNVNTQFGVRDLLMIPIKPLGEFWYIYVLIFIYLIAYIRVYTRTEK